MRGPPLGVLGGVDHFANEPASLSIGMVGRQYRLVVSQVVNGELIETPVDDRLFDSIQEARRARAGAA